MFYPVLGWILYLPASYGALLYLYFRNSILDKALGWKDVIFFLPLLVCYGLNIDLLLSSGQEVAAWLKGESTTNSAQRISKYIMFLQAPVFAFITILIIRRYQQQARNTLSAYNPVVFKWFWGAITFNVIIWSLKTIANFTREDLWVFYASDILIVVFIYFVAMVQWRHPKLFTIARLSETANYLKENNDVTLSKGGTTGKGALDIETRTKLFDAVKQQVEEGALYRNGELTLAGLAQSTGISAHHLSEVLNQHEGKNFYQFINEYRVADVCKQLKKDNDQKIMDIAINAGFSSKSTFNAIFKQSTGETPTQYRQNMFIKKS